MYREGSGKIFKFDKQFPTCIYTCTFRHNYFPLLQSKISAE